MKKSLRIALWAVLAALGLACIVLIFFDAKPWFPWPGKGEALTLCGWSLIAISVSLPPKASGLWVARFLCAGLACAALALGVTALFTALPEAVMRRLDLSGNLIFLAALAIDGIASYIANKQNDPPQERQS